MFAARLIVLLLLTYYAWGMGHLPAEELNAFGRFVSLAFFPLFLLLYMLPTYEAWKNEHPNLAAIALVDLGWTVLGWVVAIVWALKKPEPVTVSLRGSSEAAPPVQPVRQRRHARSVPRRSWPRLSNVSIAAAKSGRSSLNKNFREEERCNTLEI
jgi:hypothetical protein